jgi:hypothetical protein
MHRFATARHWTALGLILLLPGTVFALERPFHNRGISDVRFLPGPTPGTTQLEIQWHAQVDSVTVEMDFDFDLGVTVNGNALPDIVDPRLLRFRPDVLLPVWCHLSGLGLTLGECIAGCVGFPCGEFSLGDLGFQLADCSCFGIEIIDPFAGLVSEYECLCGITNLGISLPLNLQAGDIVGVTMIPRQGTFPEQYTRDDHFEVTFAPVPTATRRTTWGTLKARYER